MKINGSRIKKKAVNLKGGEFFDHEGDFCVCVEVSYVPEILRAHNPFSAWYVGVTDGKLSAVGQDKDVTCYPNAIVNLDGEVR